MRLALLGLMWCGCSTAPVVAAAPVSRPVTGLEVEAVSGLGLFADERVRSQELLSAALLARDAGVLPPEVTRRAWALAAEGRHPFSGAACGKPLYPYEARKRWGRALGLTGSVGSYVGCERDGGCELSVYGRPLDEEEAERFTLTAAISRDGEALTALAAAIPQLTSPPPSEGGGGLLGGLGGMSSPVQEEDRLAVQVWAADSRDGIRVDKSQVPFPALTLQHAQVCTDDSVQLLIEVASTGALTRCEGEDPESSCACGQLQKLAPAAWLAGKRWSLSLGVDRKDQLTGDRKLVLSGYWNTYLQRVDVPGQKYPHFKPKVEDPSIEAWTPGSSRLATDCLANAFTGPGTINSRWALWFDAAGRPTKVVEQKGFAPLAADVAACVTRALRTAQAPCPARAGLWAMANLSVTARDPNAPQKSLKDLLGP